MNTKKILQRLLNNFKDPYFVIKIWQQMTILGFIVGIFIGVVFIQNYYINQVNTVLEDAIEQDGCFRDYMMKNSERYIDGDLGYLKNISPIIINNISNIKK